MERTAAPSDGRLTMDRMSTHRTCDERLARVLASMTDGRRTLPRAALAKALGEHVL